VNAEASLWRNRDFNLLWLGQTLSDLGGRVSGIAFPLLVLATTGSPAKAGIVNAAGTLPLILLTAPAGALVDRWSRKHVMIVADAARAVALASIVAALALGTVSFAQIVLVALVEGSGFVFFSVGERSALPSVVPDHHLEAALARNQSRDYAATLGGTPLGGLLYGLGRLVPFLFDAISYGVSVITLLLIRGDFSGDRGPRERLVAEMRAGLTWFWRQRFVRTTGLLAMGSDFVVNALFLVVLVLARERGASAALIGAMFVFLGAGGILGSLVAGRLLRRLRLQTIVVATPALVALLVPLLIVLPGRVTPGVIYGAMFFPFPAWNAAVGALRLRLTPAELQGRVASIATMLSLGPAFAASIVAGFLLEDAGTTPTVIVLFALITLVALAAFLSRAALFEREVQPDDHPAGEHSNLDEVAELVREP
jgi:MFS family permease